jgi:imidazole glycerol-phosphate synthase subunit HisF
MLKHRIVSSIVFNGKSITRGECFVNNRPVGSLIQQVKIYNLREIDELVIYNISGSVLSKKNIDNVSKHCFMPLAIGGGIRNISDIEFLLENGADKVILNSATVSTPSIIDEAVRCFGSQAITVAVDFKSEGGKLSQYINNGSELVDHDTFVWCKEAEERGAGELIVNCIDNDGKQGGYNILDTIQLIDTLNIPVVISGGAGSLEDFSIALNTNKIDAVCASSFYLFNKFTPDDVKTYLNSKSIPTRVSYS